MITTKLQILQRRLNDASDNRKWSVCSPLQAAQDGRHAHHHVGYRQSVRCIFTSEFLDLLSCRFVRQEDLVCALKET